MKRKLRLLCIDDEEIGLRIRKILLERAGYEVVTAQTAPSGIQIFQTMGFDGVVLDYLMPETNGAEIAASLKKIRPEVPILLLSAYVNPPEDVSRLVDAQALKGEGPRELLRHLRAMIDHTPS